MRRTLRSAGVGAGIGAATAALLAAVSSTAALYYARRIVTPDRHKPDDVEVLTVGAATVTLRANEETVAPGRYGLWLDGGNGHAQLGEVLEHDADARTVTRRVLGVDSGRLRDGKGRWNGYFYARSPTLALGLAHQDVVVTSEAGELPTWFVPPSPDGEGDSGGSDVWAILVHGRGGTREEGLRAVPLLHRLGMPVLIPSYRNDVDAPSSHRHSGSYHLGDTEWVDVEAAVLHALDAGAKEVVLFGWSMGGAIILQLVARSWLADRVRGLVLDAPVVDWRDVLDHHARLNRLPRPVGRLGLAMLGHRSARRLVGVDGPVDLRRLDWVTRAAELRLPVLLVHSDDDEYVPSGPSRRLAQARPDLVTHVPVAGARHTREWNVDPRAWEDAVERFLRPHLSA